jgi:hypothetical protein
LTTPPETERRLPVAAGSAFFLVLSASFLNWGTITTHYTWRFMANLEHPGLCNRVLTNRDLSQLRIGTDVHYSGSAWQSGFDIFGIFYPHGVLTVAAVIIFALAMRNDFFRTAVNPAIPQLLAFYGLLHVLASALGFFSQGVVGWGLVLTGLGYAVLVVATLRRPSLG